MTLTNKPHCALLNLVGVCCDPLKSRLSQTTTCHHQSYSKPSFRVKTNAENVLSEHNNTETSGEPQGPSSKETELPGVRCSLYSPLLLTSSRPAAVNTDPSDTSPTPRATSYTQQPGTSCAHGTSPALLTLSLSGLGQAPPSPRPLHPTVSITGWPAASVWQGQPEPTDSSPDPVGLQPPVSTLPTQAGTAPPTACRGSVPEAGSPPGPSPLTPSSRPASGPQTARQGLSSSPGFLVEPCPQIPTTTLTPRDDKPTALFLAPRASFSHRNRISGQRPFRHPSF